MLFVLGFDAGAEAERGDADGDPGELVGDADDAVTHRSGIGGGVGMLLGRTYFCSQVHSWPAPMKLAPKQRILMTDVASTAIQGT